MAVAASRTSWLKGSESSTTRSTKNMAMLAAMAAPMPAMTGLRYCEALATSR